MCVRCFDQSTEDLIASTGISPEGMGMIDDLVIAAINLGDRLTQGDRVTGDPLLSSKEQLATYMARLEEKAREHHVPIDALRPDPLSAPAVMPPAPEISS